VDSTDIVLKKPEKNYGNTLNFQLKNHVSHHQGQPAYKVLVVDDNELNCEMLSRRLLRDGYEVVAANNGLDAISLLGECRVDLVLLDIMMPDMDGYELLECLKEDVRFMHIPVIMITAIDEMESVVRCIEMGAEDYLPKPFNHTLLSARVRSSLARKQLHDNEIAYRDWIEQWNEKLENRVQSQVEEISSSQLAAIFAMSKLAESKDPETGTHLERMREYCKLISETLARQVKYSSIIDQDYVKNIYAASPLHDIGKVGVPDHILLKPGKLTDEEWVEMRRHTVIGAETLRAVDQQHPGNRFIEIGIEIAEGHHEKWDGTGYPYGRKGDEIPLSARILALGDVYDALTSVRCYKNAFSHQDSRKILIEGSGKHFDPAVVDAFLETEEEFIRIRSELQDPD
jgi:putative two-component system response regulator